MEVAVATEVKNPENASVWWVRVVDGLFVNMDLQMVLVAL